MLPDGECGEEDDGRDQEGDFVGAVPSGGWSLAVTRISTNTMPQGPEDVLPDKVEDDEATDTKERTDPVHWLRLAGRVLGRKQEPKASKDNHSQYGPNPMASVVIRDFLRGRSGAHEYKKPFPRCQLGQETCKQRPQPSSHRSPGAEKP